MRVWRVEHARTGCGPYNMRDLEEWEEVLRDEAMYGTSQIGLAHPAPWDDGIAAGPDSEWREVEKFGFVSLEALNKWFPLEWREGLALAGYVAKVFNVPSEYVVVGWRQLMFDTDHANLVEVLELPTGTPRIQQVEASKELVCVTTRTHSERSAC